MNRRGLLLLVSCSFILGAFCGNVVFESDNHYAVNSPLTAAICFTPGMACTDLIVNEIDQAKEFIWVQAYGFTSLPITNALIRAKQRAVEVAVILDKSQVTSAYSTSATLTANGIPTFIDNKPAIAHNKVIVVDGHTTITGSFNFTQSAQDRNAENVLIVYNPEVTQRYMQNWQIRQSQSLTHQQYVRAKNAHRNA